MTTPKDQLAPAGKLRVGINLSNFLLIAKAADGSVSGIVPDLAAELGRRLGVPVEFVHYAGPGQLVSFEFRQSEFQQSLERRLAPQLHA